MSNHKSSQSVLTPEDEHRRQTLWQVYVPTFLGAAVFVALCVWAVLFTAGYVPEPNLPDQQTPAAKVAVIWLLLPTCFGGLIQMALLGGTVYLLARGIHGFPELAHKVQDGFNRAAAFARQLSDRLAAPVIAVASQKSGVERFFERITFWKHTTRGE